ncbi:unnamed protein product, partial [Prorocentrum cordatum]
MCPGRGGGRTWTSYHGPPRGGRRPPGDLPGGEEVVPGEDLRRQKLWFHHYDRTVALLCHRRRQLSQRGVATFYHESPQAAAARQFHRRCTTSRRCSTASGPGASDASRPRAPRGARPPEVSPAAGHRSGAERLEARAPEWPPAPRSQEASCPVYRERALHQPSELRAARSLSKTTTGRRCVFSVRE